MTTADKIRAEARKKIRIRVTSKRRAKHGFVVAGPNGASHCSSIKGAEQLLLATVRCLPVSTYEIRLATKEEAR